MITFRIFALECEVYFWCSVTSFESTGQVRISMSLFEGLGHMSENSMHTFALHIIKK